MLALTIEPQLLSLSRHLKGVYWNILADEEVILALFMHLGLSYKLSIKMLMIQLVSKKDVVDNSKRYDISQNDVISWYD